MIEPRMRVCAILRRGNRILLIRQEKHGDTYWMLPGGGVHYGETLTDALHRELEEECGISEDVQLEGPVAVVESISPERALQRKHVVHLIFAVHLAHPSLEMVASQDTAVRGHRLFGPEELVDIVVHPPIQRFLARWQPGDPTVYLGALWAR
ncbi:MAG: NUDIX hydrolase [Thermoleophilia bacterium]|nr:NUDIX hydrolase [Thermoleophilia bacterium]MDQ3857561.1 NUDIX hydrolase [Actinomycetota bacterium]